MKLLRPWGKCGRAEENLVGATMDTSLGQSGRREAPIPSATLTSTKSSDWHYDLQVENQGGRGLLRRGL